MQTLILIHIGERFPHYLKDCIHQARTINPVNDTNIILIVNMCHFQEVEIFKQRYKIIPCYIDYELCPTPSHKEFLTNIKNKIDLSFRKQYWQYVVERFFILEEYMIQYNVSNIYMIETDNLVYVPLSIVSKTEQLFSQGMAVPYDSTERGYPSFMFFRKAADISLFTRYILECIKQGFVNDMDILSKYRHMYPSHVFAYPVIPHSCNNPPRDRANVFGHITSAKDCLFLTHPQFPIIFDAIAYGQSIGGIDPCNTNGNNTLGHINVLSLYTINDVEFKWVKSNNLWLPYANNMPIVNLHIHSKALSCFLSDKLEPPTADYNPKVLEINLTKEFN
jgi:hypothetical protein